VTLLPYSPCGPGEHDGARRRRLDRLAVGHADVDSAVMLLRARPHGFLRTPNSELIGPFAGHWSGIAAMMRAFFSIIASRSFNRGASSVIDAFRRSSCSPRQAEGSTPPARGSPDASSPLTASSSLGPPTPAAAAAAERLSGPSGCHMRAWSCFQVSISVRTAATRWTNAPIAACWRLTLSRSWPSSTARLFVSRKPPDISSIVVAPSAQALSVA
jgi:hypothetical protein